MLVFIRFYQALNHIKHQVLLTVFGYSIVCRHRPTCSEYTAQQIQTNGTIVGLWRGLTRLLTCY